jgi:hypothetical protein
MDSDYLDAMQELWELEVTRLLEKHIPTDRRYLVERLRRLVFPPSFER